jgi:WD40 repeat protein
MEMSGKPLVAAGFASDAAATTPVASAIPVEVLSDIGQANAGRVPAELVGMFGDTRMRVTEPGSFRFSPDGKKLYHSYGNTQVFDTTTGRLIGSLPLVFPLRGISPDGSRLLGGIGSDLAVAEAATCKVLFQIPGKDKPVNGVFSCDGKFVVVGCEDGKVRFYDAADGKLSQTFEGHPAGLGRPRPIAAAHSG